MRILDLGAEFPMEYGIGLRIKSRGKLNSTQILRSGWVGYEIHSQTDRHAYRTLPFLKQTLSFFLNEII